MLTKIKHIVKSAIFRNGRHLVWLPEDAPTGLSLEKDIPLLCKSPSPTIFDVGANNGQSVNWFKELFNDSKIHSFEPTKKCFSELEANFSTNESIKLYNIALGEAESEHELIEFEQSVFNSMLSLDASDQNAFKDIAVRCKSIVKVKTLDQICNEAGIDHIDILKIDTQGWDLSVLKGAEYSLQKQMIDMVLVEINFDPLYESQCTPTETMEFLIDHNLRFVDYYDIFRNNGAISWCNALFIR